MQQKADEEARRARMAAVRKKRKPTVPGSGRKPRKVTPREPIAVSVKEALSLVPIGRSKLFAALGDGTVKSRLVFGVRAIDYRSLKAAFAPTEVSATVADTTKEGESVSSHQ